MLPAKLSSQGFVFLTVLVFLQILSLLGLSSLMNISTLSRSFIHDWQKTEFLMIADKVLRTLEENVKADGSLCLIPRTSSDALVKKPLSWWRTHTCHGNLHQIRYYYAVESLGADPCGIVSQNDDNDKLVAHYYRLTLLALTNNKNDASMHLQSTMVTSTVATTKCIGKSHQVLLGRQMVREI